METEKMNSKEVNLKHLGFVRIAAIQTLISLSHLYDYAKQNSGPLKSAVGKVEGAVTSVVSPVYHKFKDVPDSLLLFLDHKVGEVSYKFDKHAPPMAKKVVTISNVLIHKATEKAQYFVKEARTGGPKAAFSYAATEYKGFVVTNSVKVWSKLNQYKPVHVVGDKSLPVVANWSRFYNEMVTNMTQMGYPVVGYFPLVPVDDIVKAYEKEDAKMKKGDAAAAAATTTTTPTAAAATTTPTAAATTTTTPTAGNTTATDAANDGYTNGNKSSSDSH